MIEESPMSLRIRDLREKIIEHEKHPAGWNHESLIGFFGRFVDLMDVMMYKVENQGEKPMAAITMDRDDANELHDLLNDIASTGEGNALSEMTRQDAKNLMFALRSQLDEGGDS
jgi:hypothetical protein